MLVRPGVIVGFRKDIRAEINVGAWTGFIIGVVVLFIVAAALLPTFLDSLTDYDNATTDPIGAVIPVLGPILLSVALLFVLIGVLLKRGMENA